MAISSESAPQTRDPLNGLTLDTRGGSYILRKVIYCRPNCCVVKAQRTDTSLHIRAQRVVIKAILSSAARTSEEKLVNKARAVAIDAGGDSHWVLRHLPRIIHSEELPIIPGSTQTRIAEMLHDASSSSCKTREEDFFGALRIVIMEELLPIDTLTSACDFAQVFFDVLNCHKWLHDVPRILHRDISRGNIMYRRGDDGAVYGVLNDMDLSSDLNDLEDLKATSMRRTGTPPFMAIDLLRKYSVQPNHIYRHDLESLFYVMLILFTRYDLLLAGKSSLPMEDRAERLVKRRRPPLREWFDPTLSWDTLAVEKSDFFMSPRLDDGPFETENMMSSSFADFTDWISDLRDALEEGIEAQGKALRQARREKKSGKAPSKKPFSNATLGGKFQYSTFFDVMKNFGAKALRAPPYSLDTNSTA